MASEEEITRDLRDIEEEWKRITATPTQPRSLMHVIEYGLGDIGRGEVYVTRLLRYLLDPSEPHGMDAGFLKAFLEGFATRFEFEEPLYDLSDTRVRNEVWIRMDPDTQPSRPSEHSVDTGQGAETTSSGRVDLVIDKPGEWYFLIELKFSAEENNLAGEGLSQTEFYRTATHIGETPKSDYDNRGYYLFIHKTNTDEAADTQQFMNWTWEQLRTDVIQPFISREGAIIPHRTFAQLDEFLYDIRTLTDMTREEPNEEKKAELYLENYELLNDLHRSFEDRWEAFTNQWHTDLTGMLDESIEAFYEVEDGILAVDLGDDRRDETWYFRAKQKDWQPIFKKGWWTPVNEERWKNDELESLHKKSSDHDTLRVQYIHRMENNRDVAIEDNTLIFTFRNAGANSKPFYDIFSEAVDDRKGEIQGILPDSATWLGHKSNQFELHLEIPEPDPSDESKPEDFYEAYTATLRTAFVELVIENPELTNTLTEIYDDAVAEHMRSVVN